MSDIVRKETGAIFELWIARETLCKSWGTVFADEQRQDRAFLIELATGWNGGGSRRHGRAQMETSKLGGTSLSARYLRFSAAQMWIV